MEAMPREEPLKNNLTGTNERNEEVICEGNEPSIIQELTRFQPANIN